MLEWKLRGVDMKKLSYTEYVNFLKDIALELIVIGGIYKKNSDLAREARKLIKKAEVVRRAYMGK